jgi:hypothetical protein
MRTTLLPPASPSPWRARCRREWRESAGFWKNGADTSDATVFYSFLIKVLRKRNSCGRCPPPPARPRPRPLHSLHHSTEQGQGVVATEAGLRAWRDERPRASGGGAGVGTRRAFLLQRKESGRYKSRGMQSLTVLASAHPRKITKNPDAGQI